MPVFLETKRLIIQTPQLSDFDNLYALQSDADVMQYVGNGVRSREEVLVSLNRAIAHQQKHGFSLGSVYEKESGVFVGRAGLVYLAFDDGQADIEVGYALIKSAWGKGYATELTKTLIAWGFNHLAVNRLVGIIKPKNEASRRVLEKANMHYVGPSSYCNIPVDRYEILKKI